MTPPYNVLILKSDEHNPFIASTAGHPFIVTPNLTRLAANGTIYDNCYCPSPLCAPSRTSYLTGLPVHDIQVYNNCLALPRPHFPTHGAILHQHGVHSVHVGKVDAHRPPDELGFSEMHGHGFRGRAPDAHIRRNPVSVRTKPERARQVGVRPGEADALGAHAVTDMDHALAFLTGRATELDRPWTLEVNLNPPHFPHHVTPELWELYAGHADLPDHDINAPSADHPYAQDLRRHFNTVEMTPVIREHRRAYYGRITWVDRQLGRLLDTLEEIGLEKTTVVGYTSDHGEMLGKFGMWWKCSMFDDSVRVPLIVAGPEFGSGIRVRTPVTHWDLQASLFYSTRVERPSEWSGEALQTIPVDDPARAVFAEYSGHGTRASAFLVRRGPWKLIWNAQAPHQLFQLENDPQELHNCATEYPETVDELTNLLRDQFCDPEREQERAETFIQAQIAALTDAGIAVP